jgi:hypothetical protein
MSGIFLYSFLSDSALNTIILFVRISLFLRDSLTSDAQNCCNLKANEIIKPSADLEKRVNENDANYQPGIRVCCFKAAKFGGLTIAAIRNGDKPWTVS